MNSRKNYAKRIKFTRSTLKRQSDVNIMNITLDNADSINLSSIHRELSRTALRSIKKKRCTDILFDKAVNNEFTSAVCSRKRTLNFMQEQFKIATLFWNNKAKSMEKVKDITPLFNKAVEEVVPCKRKDPSHILRIRSDANDLRFIQNIRNNIILQRENDTIFKKTQYRFINKKDRKKLMVKEESYFDDYQRSPDKCKRDNLFFHIKHEVNNGNLVSISNFKQTTHYGNLYNLPQMRTKYIAPRRHTSNFEFVKKNEFEKHKKVVINLSKKIANIVQDLA